LVGKIPYSVYGGLKNRGMKAYVTGMAMESAAQIQHTIANKPQLIFQVKTVGAEAGLAEKLANMIEAVPAINENMERVSVILSPLKTERYLCPVKS
jgi:malate/lactate dehydrogenase